MTFICSNEKCKKFNEKEDFWDCNKYGHRMMGIYEVDSNSLSRSVNSDYNVSQTYELPANNYTVYPIDFSADIRDPNNTFSRMDCYWREFKEFHKIIKENYSEYPEIKFLDCTLDLDNIYHITIQDNSFTKSQKKIISYLLKKIFLGQLRFPKKFKVSIAYDIK